MPAQFLSGAVLSIDLYVTKDFFKGNPYRFVTVLSNDMTGLEKKGIGFCYLCLKRENL